VCVSVTTLTNRTFVEDHYELYTTNDVCLSAAQEMLEQRLCQPELFDVVGNASLAVSKARDVIAEFCSFERTEVRIVRNGFRKF
jgi:hypothetical protein